MPLCARCFGVLTGQLLGILVALSGAVIPVWIGATLAIPMGIDWGLQKIFSLRSTNRRRLLTGVCGGFGCCAIYVVFLRYAWKAFTQ